MEIKGLVDEDFVNYYKVGMFIIFPNCTFKCGKKNCQNYNLDNYKRINVSIDGLIKRYMKNPITSALICAGLEPMDSWEDLKELIQKFREQTDDDIVIYTGYNKDEINERVKRLSQYKNIIIKFGRYVAGQSPHFDNVLGVNLISDNQYAEKIS